MPLTDALSVVICVPARNERRALPGLLAALAGLDGIDRSVAVCIYLDACTDDSATVLDRAASTLPFALQVEVGMTGRASNAGVARHAAMAMGVARLAGAEGLLFTTDADTWPRRDWITSGTAALARSDIVAGRIMRRNGMADGTQSRIEWYYDRLYACRRRIDPVPWEAHDTHHFSGGANMATRSSVYRALGGFRPLPSAEDATLLDDAARAGFRVRRDGAMIVETSSRRHGRAPAGLASALQALDAGEPPLFVHPRILIGQWQAHAAMRAGFARIEDDDMRTQLGRQLGLSGDHVLGVARDCPNAEAFAMRIVPAPQGADDLVTLQAAEDALTSLELAACEVAA